MENVRESHEQGIRMVHENEEQGRRAQAVPVITGNTNSCCLYNEVHYKQSHERGNERSLLNANGELRNSEKGHIKRAIQERGESKNRRQRKMMSRALKITRECFFIKR